MSAADISRDAEQLIWHALNRAFPVAPSHLEAASGFNRSAVGVAIRKWLEEGCITKTEKRKGWYEIAPVKGKQPAVLGELAALRAMPQRDGLTCMWNAVRMMGAFSPTDLAVAATTETINVTEADAAGFCRVLLRGGYLRVVRKAKPPHRPASYRLIRNTGPLPPVERRVTGIWDPNDASFAYLPEPKQ